MTSTDEWAEFLRTATPEERALHERAERLREARIEERLRAGNIARVLAGEEAEVRRQLAALVSARKAPR